MDRLKVYSGEWNENLVRDSFLPEEEYIILGIPLCASNSDGRCLTVAFQQVMEIHCPMVFPRRARKSKAGDSAHEELATANKVQGPYMPIALERSLPLSS
ncbi:hypothetical protein Dsin_028420 [Dipteronia sinensis]|uniref:Uncharacterized protein n=1 Tax=Dipteronia sinensis TaxID=43782 RepID=A0AAE0DUK1_9ROSI|nr:hypothetical protein Dsin_028420 [Dipteronia sinensis]